MPLPKVSIIGPGRVGSALARALREKRYRIAALAGGSAEGLRAARDFIGAGKATRSASLAARAGDVVFITAPDRMIRPVCEEIARSKGFRKGAIVLHCCGAHGPELLESARACKAHIGALHPVQSFASPEAAIKRLKGAWFTFDGDAEAALVVEGIVKALGGRLASIAPRDRAMYHAATCVLSNYLVSIADLGMILLQLSGMDAAEAAKATQPLLRGTVENIASEGVPQALTGPISRGDAETVTRHLQALRTLPAEVRRLYAELGLYTVRVARRKGTLPPAEALVLTRLLQEAVGGRGNG